MISPNRNTTGLAILLGAMWYAGTSQSNSAAYLLGFVLLSVAIVSAVHTWANAHGITLTAGSITPVFAGDELRVPLVATTNSRRAHAGLRIKPQNSRELFLLGVVHSDQPQHAEICVPTGKRGFHQKLKVRLSTQYPLGFFTATRALTLDQPHYIYPTPDGVLPLPRGKNPSRHAHNGARRDGDEFAGTRLYQNSDSQRHIDWKAVARGQPLLIKQWQGEAGDLLIFDWEELGQLSWEARLSQLTQWIVLAERLGMSYGLKLPARVIQPGHQQAHFHDCLRALALFPSGISDLKSEISDPLPPRISNLKSEISG